MTPVSVQFPAAVAGGTLKRRVQVLAGRLLAKLNPTYAEAVAQGRLPPQIGRRERLLIAALVDRHTRNGTLDELAPLHDWLWRGEQAVTFHHQATARFEDWWLQHHSRIAEPLQQLLEAPGSPYRWLCEIGCGSGLVLEDLCKRLPSLQGAVGLDLSPGQTALNRTRAVDPRIRFEHGDARTWVPEHGRAGSIYLTVAGVFEYFRRTDLQRLFASLAKAQAPCAIALIEPVAADHDLENDPTSRPYGYENSLGHNYPLLLREAGFAIRFQQRQLVAGQTFLLLVAESTG